MTFPWDRWPRLAYLSAALVAAGLIAYALYTQYYLYLEPCPLCMWQRLFVVLLGVVFLAAAVHNPGAAAAKAYAGLIALLALLGAAVSARHVWIQNLPPDQVPLCQQISFGAMPFGRFLTESLRGTGECADKSWRLLGLTMPMWTLLCFICFGVAAWVLAYRKRAV